MHSVDFRGFRVGAGEDNLQEPLNQFFKFSVFLCDFRVFRVMIRPSKRIPYTKSKYIQRIHTGILVRFISCFHHPLYARRKKRKRITTADVLEGFAPRGSQIKDLLSDSLRSLARKFPPKTWSQTFGLLKANVAFAPSPVVLPHAPLFKKMRDVRKTPFFSYAPLIHPLPELYAY